MHCQTGTTASVSRNIFPVPRVSSHRRKRSSQIDSFKILSRITQPTIGKVRVYGRLASLLEVETGFHPEFSGRDNIYLNGTMLGLSRKEVREGRPNRGILRIGTIHRCSGEELFQRNVCPVGLFCRGPFEP